jgi:hypothetical protein
LFVETLGAAEALAEGETMGDKSPKSKNRIKVQKNAAKADKKAKRDKRQAGYASVGTDGNDPGQKKSA